MEKFTRRKHLLMEIERLRKSNAELGKELVDKQTELATAVAQNVSLTAQMTNVYSILCTMVNVLHGDLHKYTETEQEKSNEEAA